MSELVQSELWLCAKTWSESESLSYLQHIAGISFIYRYSFVFHDVEQSWINKIKHVWNILMGLKGDSWFTPHTEGRLVAKGFRSPPSTARSSDSVISCHLSAVHCQENTLSAPKTLQKDRKDTKRNSTHRIFVSQLSAPTEPDWNRPSLTWPNQLSPSCHIHNQVNCHNVSSPHSFWYLPIRNINEMNAWGTAVYYYMLSDWELSFTLHVVLMALFNQKVSWSNHIEGPG